MFVKNRDFFYKNHFNKHNTDHLALKNSYATVIKLLFQVPYEKKKSGTLRNSFRIKKQLITSCNQP